MNVLYIWTNGTLEVREEEYVREGRYWFRPMWGGPPARAVTYGLSVGHEVESYSITKIRFQELARTQDAVYLKQVD